MSMRNKNTKTRKLIHETKVALYKSLNKWRNLMVHSFNKDPLKCSCG